MSAPTKTWDSSFESTPPGTGLVSNVDTNFQDFKVAVRERIEREHYLATGGTQSQHGWHKAGSARAFYYGTTTSATNKLDPSTSILDQYDAGRLMVSSQTYVLYVWDASSTVSGAWKSTSRQTMRVCIQGTLAYATNIVPRFVIPRACEIIKVVGYLETAPTGQALIIDINSGASNSIFSAARLQFNIGSNTASIVRTRTGSEFSTYAALVDDATLTVDIDQVGSTIAGADLSLTIEALYT